MSHSVLNDGVLFSGKEPQHNVCVFCLIVNHFFMWQLNLESWSYILDTGLRNRKQEKLILVVIHSLLNWSPKYSYITYLEPVTYKFLNILGKSKYLGEKIVKLLLLLLFNGRSRVYSISLLASQYSFGRSLAVLSSFGHFSRCSLSIIVFFCLHIVQ